ncbi:MAG: OmpA family protein [Arenimonas sp.]
MLKKLLPLILFSAALQVSAAEPVRIPLVKGLVTVTAVQLPRGDEEQVSTLNDVTPEFVEYGVEFRSFLNGKLVSDKRVRRVKRQDLASANKINSVFQEGDPAMFPGSTMGLSTASFEQLKSTGKTALVLGTVSNYGEVQSLPALLDIASGRKYFRGVLERVGNAVTPISIKLNGKSVLVQTIHAKGKFSVAGDTVDIELWLLDDSSNPVGIRSRQGRSLWQTIRIDYPTAQPQANVLQQALASGACRAELNGIYFDFGQATLLPQSAPALKAVADLMAKNPGWNLRIEGHTDSVGAAAYNLDLSKRRAAAVSNALTVQYKLAAIRLNANGFGATKPIAKNDTLEGRATNRRVELARTCP